MDKSQALYNFWSSFGIPAYDEYSVPDNAELPYITYGTNLDNIGNVVSSHGSIWYKSTSWEEVSKKSDEIAKAIGYGHKLVKIDDGYVYILRGTPFAQRMTDNNDTIKRIYINLQVEFLTET